MDRKKDTDAALRLGLPADYAEFLESLKARVRLSQTKAMLSVNRELIALYWDIGRQIVNRQDREGWGKSVVDRLAADIQINFPGIKGFSRGNVWRMRAFFLAYRTGAQILAQPARELLATNLSQAVTDLNDPILPQAVSGIPWYHNVLIFDKLKDPVQRLWYATRTLEHGWMKSQPIVELTASIQARRASEGWFRPLACASGLYFHQPTLQHGWSRAILTVQIESNLYGRQGKAVSNFTETLPSPQSDLVQQTLKDPYIFDFLTLGLVLCKTRDRITAEYALRDIAKPIGIAQWQTKLVDSLPEPLKSSLPSIEEIEAEFELHATASIDDASTTHSARKSKP